MHCSRFATFVIASLTLVTSVACDQPGSATDGASGTLSASAGTESTTAPQPSLRPHVGPTAGTAVSLPDTEQLQLSSKVVGIDYRILVSVPRDYATRKKERFAVVYVLDADYAFPLAHQIEEYLSDNKMLPELIVVGVGYNQLKGAGRVDSYKIHRTRDYTPVRPKEGYNKMVLENAGGAGKFLKFMETELFPEIDRRYRTVKEDRTIVGHSYGGVFGTWAVLERPKMFKRAVLVSPSYWYDKGWMFDYEAKRSKAIKELPVTMFLTIGKRESRKGLDMVADMHRMQKNLESRGHAGLTVRSEVEWREHHYSVFPGSLSTGLRFVFGRL